MLLLGILFFIISLLHFEQSVLAKVRGVPGVDYPNYSSIPKTSFQCPDENIPGFFADFETRCQVFHYCYEHRKESFLCPEGTIFNEAIKSCDYWYSSECDSNQVPGKARERRSENNVYNDDPLVPVKDQTNDIFNKMAALYEPKKLLQNSLLEEKKPGDDFKDITDNEIGNYDIDENYDSEFLRTQEALLNGVRENSNAGDSFRDFVKYEHDSVEDDDNIDILFYENSVKPFNKKVDMSSIGLSQTGFDRYQQQDTSPEKSKMNQVHNSEGQTEVLTILPVDSIDFSNHVHSESFLMKRLSDNLEAPKKRRFRRKPTYVVLQTQEIDESNPESTAYGVEQNRPIKEEFVDKANVYHSLQSELPISDITESEKKLKDDLVLMPGRKLRRNRKRIQIFADGSNNLTGETTKLVKEHETAKDVYGDKTDALYHSYHQKTSASDSPKIENKHENDIKMSLKSPRRNRKAFAISTDEPDKAISEPLVYNDKTNPYHSLRNETKSLALNATITENQPEGVNMSEKKTGVNSTIEIYIDELNKTNTSTTESIKQNKNSIMSANIMSPSFEIDPEPIILVSENETAILTIYSVIKKQPDLSQATVLSTSTRPNLTTTLPFSQNNLKKVDNEMANFSVIEESQSNFTELKEAEIDKVEGPNINENETEDDFIKDTQNLNFITHLLKMNSEVENRAYLEQKIKNDGTEDINYLDHDMNLDNIEDMNSKDYNVEYSDGYNPGDTVNMISEEEDKVYYEQEFNSDDSVTINSEIADGAYSEQEMYPDHIENMNPEDLEYSRNEMNPNDIVAHIISEQSQEIYHSDEKAAQYDHQNNYETSSTFSGGYDNNIFSQPAKQDNYFLISTLSPINTADESSTVITLDDNIFRHDNSDSFDDEQMSNVYEHIPDDNNINGMNSEYEERINFADEKINDDVFDSFKEEETKSFTDEEIKDFVSNKFDQALNNAETTSLRADDKADDEENGVLNELGGSSDSNERLRLQEETAFQKEQKFFSNFELSTPSEIITEISMQPNNFFKELFESPAVIKDSKLWRSESVLISDTSDESFKSSTVVEESNAEKSNTEKNLPSSKSSKVSFRNSTDIDELINKHTADNASFTNIFRQSFESSLVEGAFKEVNSNEKSPFEKISELNLVENLDDNADYDSQYERVESSHESLGERDEITDENIDERDEDTGKRFDQQDEVTDQRFDEQDEDTGERFDQQDEDTGERFDERDEDTGERFDQQDEVTNERFDERDEDTGKRFDQQDEVTNEIFDERGDDIGERFDQQDEDTDESSDERDGNTNVSFNDRNKNTDERFDELDKNTAQSFDEEDKNNDRSLNERDKNPDESSNERDKSTMHTKTGKDTYIKTKLYNEAGESGSLNMHLFKNKNVEFKKSYPVLDQIEVDKIKTGKTIAIQTSLAEELENEEKPIDSIFHSSSMPLPANIFEQGLYKQSLRQDETFDRSNIYPVTFYKELDESYGKSINEKLTATPSHNKKFRSLNSNPPIGEIDSENVDDLSLKYREPSLLSLLGPFQTVKKLLPTDFSGFKSSRTFSPLAGKTSKPINVKKLVAFGKNLLDFKRAKLNDFKTIFDSFMI